MGQKNTIDISSLRFLVADDSRFMRRLVLSVLKAFGARDIAEVATGQAAYEEICTGEHDIVLLDWEFPDRTGEAVMRSIRRAGHPGAYQTVIMMSGHDERRRIERAMRFGVNGYVAKPVAPATLYAQIRQTVLFPRPYLRTETYFGPQHPLILDALQGSKSDVPVEPIQKPAREDKPAPSAPLVDTFDIEQVAVLE